MSLIEQRRSSVLVLVFSLSIFLFLNRGWFGEMQLGDDVYIYLQYVRNIIDGGGIAFNADEPSYGFTSVLWLEALLIWTAISGNYLGGPLVFSLACSVGVILCAWFFATNDSRLGVTAFAIPMLFSIEPNLLKHALIGLETPLAGLLVMAGVLFHKREQKSLGRFPWSAVLFAASLLNRPESLLIVILVLLDKLIAQTHWKHSIMWLLLVVIPAGVWGVMAQFLTGSFFPTTAAAKGGAYPPFGSFSANLHDSLIIILPSYGLLLLLQVVQAIRGVRQDQPMRTAWLKENWLYYAIPILMVLFYCSIISREIVYARYFFIFIPLCVYATLANLFDPKISFSPNLRKLFLAAIALQFFIIAGFSASFVDETVTKRERIRDGVITWIKENTPESASLVTSTIGKIGFETRRRIICPLGIINPEIIDYRKTGHLAEFYEKARAEYFLLYGVPDDETQQYLDSNHAKIVHTFPLPKFFCCVNCSNPAYHRRSLFRISSGFRDQLNIDLTP